MKDGLPEDKPCQGCGAPMRLHWTVCPTCGQSEGPRPERGFWDLAIAAILFLLAGLAVNYFGVIIEQDAKSVMHQIYSTLHCCTGAILIAIAFLLAALRAVAKTRK